MRCSCVNGRKDEDWMTRHKWGNRPPFASCSNHPGHVHGTPLPWKALASFREDEVPSRTLPARTPSSFAPGRRTRLSTSLKICAKGNGQGCPPVGRFDDPGRQNKSYAAPKCPPRPSPAAPRANSRQHAPCVPSPSCRCVAGQGGGSTPTGNIPESARQDLPAARACWVTPRRLPAAGGGAPGPLNGACKRL